jgi:hypothetical protein
MVCKLRFKKMKKVLYILFFISSTFLGFAKDSLKVFPKFLVDLNYSEKRLMRGNFKVENIKNQLYELNILNSTTLNFQYRLSNKSKSVNQLYFGIGFSYLQGKLHHHLYGYPLSGSGLGSGSNIAYSKDDFNYDFKAIGINPHLAYNVIFKKIIIFNKLGFNCSRYFNQNQYSYQEQTYDWGYAKSAIYITAQNPEGWYYYNSTKSSIDKTDKLPNKYTISMFLGTGIGFRIGNFIPNISLEINQLFKNPSFLYTKVQIGLTYFIK